MEASKYKKTDPDRADGIYRAGIEQIPNSRDLLRIYAIFLWDVLKDYDRAEIFHKRAIKVAPNYVPVLSNYAVFLHTIRKDHTRAEEYFKRAVEGDSPASNALGNYAGFLLARGRIDDGLAKLEAAIEHPSFTVNPESPIKCWFRAYAHRPAERRPEALTELKRLLSEGMRVEHWDFSQNIVRAHEHGHPASDWLEKLAAVIIDHAEIATLDDWPAWQEA